LLFYVVKTARFQQNRSTIFCSFSWAFSTYKLCINYFKLNTLNWQFFIVNLHYTQSELAVYSWFYTSMLLDKIVLFRRYECVFMHGTRLSGISCRGWMITKSFNEFYTSHYSFHQRQVIPDNLVPCIIPHSYLRNRTILSNNMLV
jgi:hypothetical protein